MEQVQEISTDQLQQAVALPQEVRLQFDPAQENRSNLAPSCPPHSPASGQVLKSCGRTVVSLQHGRFQAREIVRRLPAQPAPIIQRSVQLAGLVAPGARYGFDLIAHVGIQSYLRGHSLNDIGEDLANRPCPIHIPKSTLWDQQQKFLFYLGHLHQQGAQSLRAYLSQQSQVTWLLDGTLEPGTAVLLGIQDASSGILLGGWKIPTESAEDIAAALSQGAQSFGQPEAILHDLSAAMSGACALALPKVPHHVCHYHLCQDVGEELYAKPQSALTKRLRTLKTQLRLREQRKGQAQWLRAQIDSQAQLVLTQLLAGQPVQESLSQSLGREVLLAFHYWILDYRGDGRRRGFPFDPYTLYLHRRLVQAGQAVDRLLSSPGASKQAPQVLFNFQKQLTQYRQDPQIVAAAQLYERAFLIFNQLRESLRLSAEDMDGLRQPQALAAAEQPQIKSQIEQLRQRLEQQSREETDTDEPLAQIVLKHLDKYWNHLVPQAPLNNTESWTRTTNDLERQWGALKRVRRQAHGRGKLSRDFQALPEEFLLVANLENPVYVELVLGGSLESLPSKLAQASQHAGSFEAWRRQHHPRPVAQLSRRLLRQDNFIDHLVGVCQQHCASHKNAA